VSPKNVSEKRQIFEAIRERVRSDLLTVRRSQRTTQAGATHPENRAEHAKDTRATETSYLARGLAERVELLERDLAALDGMSPVIDTAADRGVLGALLTLEDSEGNESVYLLAPAGGGITVEVGGVRVQALTARSPLGQALVGCEEGDEVSVNRPRGRIEAVVTQIS
jgi:transcription elongation GreA/GreB family factor